MPPPNRNGRVFLPTSPSELETRIMTALTEEQWVNAAVRTLQALAPDMDLRPGGLARGLVEAAAKQLPIRPHEVTPELLAHKAGSLARGMPEAFPTELTREVHRHGHIDIRDVRPRGLPVLPPDVCRLRQEAMAREDAAIFEVLDRIGQEGFDPNEPALVGPFPVRTELTVLPADDPHRAPLGWTVEEHVGVAAVNPRGLNRVRIPEFEIVSNPTIRLDDIQNRRFNLINRNPQTDHPLILALLAARERRAQQVPMPEPREEGPRRSAWEWVLDPHV